MWVAIGVIGLVVLGAAGIGGLFIYRNHRNASWLARAEHAYESGNWLQARRYFEWYIPQDNENIEVLLKYADACERLVQGRQGALSAAAVAYHQILGVLREQGETEQAHDIQDRLCALLRKSGAWSDLAYYGEQWLAERPDSVFLKFHRALALDQLGQEEDAIAAYTAMIEQGEAEAEVYGNLARLYLERGRREQAEDVFRTALQIDSNDAGVMAEYGRFLIQQDRAATAAEVLAPALTIAPDDPAVLMTCAALASEEGKTDQALELRKKAYELDSENGDVVLTYGVALGSAGRTREAIELFSAMDERARADTPEIFITLAELQIGAQQLEEAEATIAAFQEARPDLRTFADYLTGRLLLARGQTEDAAETLAVVREMRPDFPPVQFFLAVAYVENGEPELARGILESYLRQYPSDDRARQLLARVGGSAEDAGSVMKRAQDLLAESTASADMLSVAAYDLYRVSLRSQDALTYGETVRELFARAIERTPTNPRPYEGLTQVYLAEGNPDAAAEVVAQGKAAGVPEGSLAKSEAAIAYDRGNADEALGIGRGVLQREQAQENDAIEWVLLFLQRNRPDLAEQVVNEFRGRLDAAAQQDFDLQVAATFARHGEAERAQALLASIGAVPAQAAAAARYRDAQYAVAEQFLIQGNDSDASMGLLEEVAQAAPEGPAPLVLQAAELEGNSADGDALAPLLAEILERDSDNLYALLRLWRRESDGGNMERALEYADRAVTAAPQLPAVQLQYAELQMRAQQYDVARNIAQRLLGLDAQRPGALKVIAYSELASGNTEAAETELGRWKEAGPSDAAAAERFVGWLAVAKGAPSASVPPEQLRAATFGEIMHLVAALMRQNRQEDAETLLKQFVEASPRNLDARVGLAKVLASTNDGLQDASTQLTQALLIDPEYGPALRLMMQLQMRRGLAHEAAFMAQKYLSDHPNDGRILFLQAEAYAQSGDMAGALASVSRALAVEERPEYYGLRGQIRMRQQDYRGALDDLNAARANGPASAAVDAALAEVHVALGDAAKAREFLESARERAAAGDQLPEGRLDAVARQLDGGSSS